MAAIAFGSNLPGTFGSRQEALRTAVERISGIGRVVAVSAFFDTEPMGFKDQPRFLNGALLLDTELAPVPLLHALLAIEQAMGRVRDGIVVKGPRVIDLDLIWMDGLKVESAELVLPHPAMAERAFVLEPLAEIAPDWIHPTLGLSVLELLRRLG